jgi:hypothetical protein
MIALVAVSALGLFLAREFEEGMPPRFVVRGIPARIGRLRPGMSRAEVREILGVDTSWFWGGTGAKFAIGHGGAHWSSETYLVRPERGLGQLVDPAELIQLQFTRDPARVYGERLDLTPDSDRLVGASFSVHRRTIAEMPPENLGLFPVPPGKMERAGTERAP